MKLLRNSLVAALIVGIGAASAGAGTITPTFVGVTDLGNGTFLWEYQATLENGRLKANANPTSEEFFTFYDIAGYVPGSASDAGATFPSRWAPSDQTLGKTPAGLTPVDGAALNVSFTYISNALMRPATSTGEINLGIFSFVSTFGLADPNGVWSSQDLQRTGRANPQGASGFIELPTAAVPDGGLTVLLLGMGVTGLGWMRRRMR